MQSAVPPKNRLLFLDFLRGLACALVVFSHMLWPDQMVAQWMGRETPLLNFGQMGVGIFFLISGYVIPLSCQNVSARVFLYRRLWRIFPLIWITMIPIAMFGWWEADTVSASHSATWPRIMSTSLLIFDWLGHTPLRLVFWTLVVEMKFYLLFYVVKLLVPSLKPRHVVVWLSVMLLMLVQIAQWLSEPALVHMVVYTGFFISYMLLGTWLFLGLKWYAYFIPIFVMAVMGWRIFHMGSVHTVYGMNEVHYPFIDFARDYAVGLIIFLGVYFTRVRYQRLYANHVLCFTAFISYPLYIIHETINAQWKNIINIEGIPELGSMLLNQLCALIVAVAIAYLLHRYVEKPTIRFSKRSFLSKNVP